MAIKGELVNKKTGKRGAAAIAELNDKLNRLPERLQKSVPGYLYPTAANMIRQSFDINFLNKDGWRQKYFRSGNYMERKDDMCAERTEISIGSFGDRQVIFDSEVFGRRTDTLYSAIGGRASSKVSTHINTTAKGNTTATISIELDKSAWDEAGKENSLEMFSNQVSPGPKLEDGGKSIFMHLTDDQKMVIKRFIGVALQKYIKQFLVRNL